MNQHLFHAEPMKMTRRPTDGQHTEVRWRAGPPTGPEEENVRKKLKTMPVCWISRPVVTDPTSAASAWQRPDGRSKSSDLVTGSKVTFARSDGWQPERNTCRMTNNFRRKLIGHRQWPEMCSKVRAIKCAKFRPDNNKKWQATLKSLVAPNTTHKTADFLGRVPARILG